MMTGHFNGTLSLFTLNDSSSLNKSDGGLAHMIT